MDWNSSNSGKQLSDLPAQIRKNAPVEAWQDVAAIVCIVICCL